MHFRNFLLDQLGLNPSLWDHDLYIISKEGLYFYTAEQVHLTLVDASSLRISHSLPAHTDATIMRCI